MRDSEKWGVLQFRHEVTNTGTTVQRYLLVERKYAQ
jgi:hypothetical protein